MVFLLEEFGEVGLAFESTDPRDLIQGEFAFQDKTVGSLESLFPLKKKDIGIIKLVESQL